MTAVTAITGIGTTAAAGPTGTTVTATGTGTTEAAGTAITAITDRDRVTAGPTVTS